MLALLGGILLSVIAWRTASTTARKLAQQKFRYVTLTHHPATPWVVGGMAAVATWVTSGLAVWLLDLIPLVSLLVSGATVMGLTWGVAGGTVQGLRAGQVRELAPGPTAGSR